ncbi:MAG: hypothetical protein R3C02_18755 [Planctomycetaceae bacterium]
MADGDYRVSTTWTAWSNRATDAPFSIYNGVNGQNLVGTVYVNQELDPDDFITRDGNDELTLWEDLMVVTISNGEGTLKVELL